MRDMGCYRKYYITRWNKSQSEKMGKGAKARAPFFAAAPEKNIIDKSGTNPP
jgi:hypothetical protein